MRHPPPRLIESRLSVAASVCLPKVSAALILPLWTWPPPPAPYELFTRIHTWKVADGRSDRFGLIDWPACVCMKALFHPPFLSFLSCFSLGGVLVLNETTSSSGNLLWFSLQVMVRGFSLNYFLRHVGWQQIMRVLHLSGFFLRCCLLLCAICDATGATFCLTIVVKKWRGWNIVPKISNHPSSVPAVMGQRQSYCMKDVLCKNNDGRLQTWNESLCQWLFCFPISNSSDAAWRF